MGIQVFKSIQSLFHGSRKPVKSEYPAGGIRIVHETHRNCVVTVEVIGKPYGFSKGLPLPGYEYKVCPTCNEKHQYKTLHLWLDDAGGTVISHGVYDELQAAGSPGFSVESEVDKPAKTTIGFNHNSKRLEVHKERPRMVTYGHG